MRGSESKNGSPPLFRNARYSGFPPNSKLIPTFVISQAGPPKKATVKTALIAISHGFQKLVSVTAFHAHAIVM